MHLGKKCISGLVRHILPGIAGQGASRGVKKAGKYQVAGSRARQAWGKLGSRLHEPEQMRERCPRYPHSWVKQPGKEPQSHTHGAGK